MSEVVAQKISSLQRCVSRAREELASAGHLFATDYTAQDASILNVIRACETAIDLANMLIRKRRLGIPSDRAYACRRWSASATWPCTGIASST